MVKKAQKTAGKKAAAKKASFGEALLDGQIAQRVKDSAQQIWSAGLGAFSKAQGEPGKVFESLVSEGMKLQKKTQSAAEAKLGAVAEKVNDMAGDVSQKAGQQWDKLESIFEDRVAKALNRLGVPSAQDVAALTQRINALEAALGVKPAKKAAAKPAAAAKKPVVAKAPVKAVAKKAVVKAAAKPAAKKAVAKPVAKAPVKAPAKAPIKAAAKKVAVKKTAAVPAPSAAAAQA